jgi:hypothetical protein
MDENQRIYFSLDLPKEVADKLDLSVGSDGSVFIKWKTRMLVEMDVDGQKAFMYAVTMRGLVVHAVPVGDKLP